MVAFALVLAGVALAAVPAQAGSGTGLPHNGKIAFAGSSGFYTINPDGSGLKLILKAIANPPAWSPDGKQIAFGGDGGIAVMNADGTHGHAITKGVDSDPTWSPDGTRIAFTRRLPGSGHRPDIWVVNVRTRAVRQLTRTPQVIESTPDWSPDGTKIMVGQTPRSIVYPPTVLRTVDPNGGQHYGFVTNLPAEQAVWSPDGTEIAFTSADIAAGEPDIWVMNTNGTGLQNLTAGSGATNVNPAWSPDGKQIAFRSDRGNLAEAGDIWVMGADGSAPKRLTSFGLPGPGKAPSSTQVADYPAWQPLP